MEARCRSRFLWSTAPAASRPSRALDLVVVVSPAHPLGRVAGRRHTGRLGVTNMARIGVLLVMPLLTTAQVAAEVGFSADWVREHAHELGGIRTGPSKHSQLRFDPDGIDAWKALRQLAVQSPPAHRARRRRPLATALELLPIPDRR